MTTSDSIILNLSHPHMSQLATIPGTYRDLTLMTFVAEGFVDLLGTRNKEEYKEMTDKVVREMLKLYGQELKQQATSQEKKGSTSQKGAQASSPQASVEGVMESPLSTSSSPPKGTAG
jgi:predicted kinase